MSLGTYEYAEYLEKLFTKVRQNGTGDGIGDRTVDVAKVLGTYEYAEYLEKLFTKVGKDGTGGGRHS